MGFGGFWNRWDARVEKENTKRLVSKVRASEAEGQKLIMVLVCKRGVHPCDQSPWILIFYTANLVFTPGNGNECKHLKGFNQRQIFKNSFLIIPALWFTVHNGFKQKLTTYHV